MFVFDPFNCPICFLRVYSVRIKGRASMINLNDLVDKVFLCHTKWIKTSLIYCKLFNLIIFDIF